MQRPHILLVTFPSQGHINPSLQFAKRLIRIGAHVTFATSTVALRRMKKTTATDGLSFAAFADANDDGFNPDNDITHYMSELKRRGSQTLAEIIRASINEGCPFTCVVYCTLIPWAAKVAREFHLPSTLLWNQPAAIFDVYYYYFNGYGDIIKNNITNPSFSVKLPGLPLLASHDLPSFFLPSNPHAFALPKFKEHLDVLDEETNPKILVNTFDALESDALKAIDKYNLVGVGPLIPSAFLDGKDPSDTSFGGDLFKSSKDYLKWLNLQSKSSVIYVSFGSISVLSKLQMEELARALLDSGRPFLWVIRAKQNGGGEEEEEKGEDRLSCREELEEKGMIVPWCSQVEVLSHESIGCFVTHCGWNSTFESLASGVPVVAFPQWTDQITNAKLIEDLWKTGVRVNNYVIDEGIVVKSEEIKRCLESMMGERGEERRRNAQKWKDLAREAAREGGSSDKNLKAFVEELGKGC